MEVNMQNTRLKPPHPISAARLKILHLYPQSTIRNPQHRAEAVAASAICQEDV
jgi:hypothetical protein